MERQSPVAGVEAFAALLTDYSAAAAWVVEREGMHTRLNLVPSAFTRNSRGPFQVHLVLYSDQCPDGLAWVSKKSAFDRDLRIDLGRVFADRLKGPFEGFIEVVATSPRQDLRPQHYNEMWLDYHADDGRMQLVLPTIQFYGSVKRTLGGQDQLWPGLLCSEQLRPQLVIINPYREAVEFTLSALTPDGQRNVGRTLSIAAKSQVRLRLDRQFDDLVGFLAGHNGVGTLLIGSSYKMICYFLIENITTGTISGGDHLAWFYGVEV